MPFTRLVILAATLTLAHPAAALAQDGANIDLQAFRPAMDSRGFITVNGSAVLAPGQPSFGLVTTWGRGLLQLEGDGNRYEVQHLITPTLVGAIGFRILGVELEAGAALPFTVMAGDRSPDGGSATPDPNDDVSHRFDGQGLADAALRLKWRLRGPPRGQGLGLAIIGSLTLPTASQEDRWLGNSAAMPEVAAVADYIRGRFAMAANVGMRWRERQRFTDDQPAMDGSPLPSTRGVIQVGSSIPGGLAASYAVVPERFDLMVELFGAVPLDGENDFPLEALAGLKLYLAESSHLSFGAGAGLLDRGANPDTRAFVAIVFEPRPAFQHADRVDPSRPRPPRLPGDRDEDGIVDPDDGCPDDPEDVDGFQDEDGCPDPDNDGDLILDVDDLCIDRPEKYNTVEDEDGCPDRGPVIERDGEIEILDVIEFEFDSDVIQEQSHGILRAVARTILQSPAIQLVEVRGHTDERGSAAYNLDLSKRRARSVLEFLAGEGVARERLDSRGFGEEKPLIREHTEAAWARNRRVEFIIARRARPARP
jgi:outer membrane protein OmpA-like peptidoglycan-associated protein